MKIGGKEEREKYEMIEGWCFNCVSVKLFICIPGSIFCGQSCMLCMSQMFAFKRLMKESSSISLLCVLPKRPHFHIRSKRPLGSILCRHHFSRHRLHPRRRGVRRGHSRPSGWRHHRPPQRRASHFLCRHCHRYQPRRRNAQWKQNSGLRL